LLKAHSRSRRRDGSETALEAQWLGEQVVDDLWEHRGGFRVIVQQDDLVREWFAEPAGLSGQLAAAFGLRGGDQIVVPMGDAMIEIDAVLEIIERGGELTVAREEGNFWIDRILPDPNSSETSPPPSQPAREVQDTP
jgi:hypothetical protein